MAEAAVAFLRKETILDDFFSFDCDLLIRRRPRLPDGDDDNLDQSS